MTILQSEQRLRHGTPRRRPTERAGKSTFGRFAARRVASSLLVLLVLSIVVFLMVRLIPGDPVLKLFDARSQPSPAEIEAVRERLGLQGSWPIQYGRWLGGVMRGDFGTSLAQPYEVGEQIAKRLPLSIELAFMATLFAVGVGVPLGVIAGARQGSKLDALIGGTSFVFISTPTFILGVLVVLINSRTTKANIVGFAYFADDPLGNLRLMVIPAIVLGVGLAAYISRYTRAGLIDDLERPHVKTMQAFGASRPVIVRHCLRNALIPVTTVTAIELGALVGGTVVVEKIFAIPGMGSLLMDSIQRSDYPAIQGSILVIAVVYLVMNLAVDLAYPLIDPRVRIAA